MIITEEQISQIEGLKIEIPENDYDAGYNKAIKHCSSIVRGILRQSPPVIQAKEIRDEMDADMEESGMAQGEIESCLNHWSNKYLIIRKP